MRFGSSAILFLVAAGGAAGSMTTSRRLRGRETQARFPARNHTPKDNYDNRIEELKNRIHNLMEDGKNKNAENYGDVQRNGITPYQKESLDKEDRIQTLKNKIEILKESLNNIPQDEEEEKENSMDNKVKDLEDKIKILKETLLKNRIHNLMLELKERMNALNIVKCCDPVNGPGGCPDENGSFDHCWDEGGYCCSDGNWYANDGGGGNNCQDNQLENSKACTISGGDDVGPGDANEEKKDSFDAMSNKQDRIEDLKNKILQLKSIMEGEAAAEDIEENADVDDPAAIEEEDDEKNDITIGGDELLYTDKNDITIEGDKVLYADTNDITIEGEEVLYADKKNDRPEYAVNSILVEEKNEIYYDDTNQSMFRFDENNKEETNELDENVEEESLITSQRDELYDMKNQIEDLKNKLYELHNSDKNIAEEEEDTAPLHSVVKEALKEESAGGEEEIAPLSSAIEHVLVDRLTENDDKQDNSDTTTMEKSSGEAQIDRLYELKDELSSLKMMHSSSSGANDQEEENSNEDDGDNNIDQEDDNEEMTITSKRNKLQELQDRLDALKSTLTENKDDGRDERLNSLKQELLENEEGKN